MEIEAEPYNDFFQQVTQECSFEKYAAAEQQEFKNEDKLNIIYLAFIWSMFIIGINSFVILHTHDTFSRFFLGIMLSGFSLAPSIIIALKLIGKKINSFNLKLFPRIRKEHTQFLELKENMLSFMKNEDFQHLFLLKLKSLHDGLELVDEEKTNQQKLVLTSYYTRLRDNFIYKQYDDALRNFTNLHHLCLSLIGEDLVHFQKVSDFISEEDKYKKELIAEFENKQKKYQKEINIVEEIIPTKEINSYRSIL